MTPKRLVFLSVVPSPYQRDVFSALAARNRIPIQVHYLERAAPDSPWPEPDQTGWEDFLPGFTLGRGTWRSHVNWRVPQPLLGEVWVVNGAMTDVTTQRVIRRLGRRTPWCFWGEVPSRPRSAARAWLQRRQYAPLTAARAIVAVGQRARDVYAAMMPGLPIYNQPYLCRLADFTAMAARRTPGAETIFLFCGQMVARKGVDVLLRAFARLVGENLPARLELVGREADLPAFMAQVSSNVRSRVSYLGFKSPADLPAAFARADVFVLPSRHDGWGVVVNQALGAGLPVICSDAVGAGHDLIERNVNGMIVPAGDVDSLTAAMRRLAESPELRRTFGQASLAASARLSPELAAEFWENLAEKFSATP